MKHLMYCAIASILVCYSAMIIANGRRQNTRLKPANAQTALHQPQGFFSAVEQDNIDKVREFLALPNINVNKHTKKMHKTALHLVCSETMANLLLDAGADVDAHNRFNQTPLYRARNRAIAGTLITRGADVNARDCWGRTPLHYAQTAGMIKELTDARADVGVVDKDCRTPLYYAEDPHVALALLQNGADPDLLDAFDLRPIDYIVNVRMPEAGSGSVLYASLSEVVEVLRNYQDERSSDQMEEPEVSFEEYLRANDTLSTENRELLIVFMQEINAASGQSS